MAHNDYLIRYSNGFKRHVSRAERDLLLAFLQQVGPREYLCSVSLQSDLEQTSGPDFLPGQFTIEYPLRYGRRRESERLQTVKRMVLDLRQRGFSQEVTA